VILEWAIKPTGSVKGCHRDRSERDRENHSAVEAWRRGGGYRVRRLSMSFSLIEPVDERRRVSSYLKLRYNAVRPTSLCGRSRRIQDQSLDRWGRRWGV